MKVLGYRVYKDTKANKYKVEVKNDIDYEYHEIWYSNERIDAINTAILLARTLEEDVPVFVQRLDNASPVFKMIFNRRKKK